MMSKSTLRRLSKAMPDDKALEFLSDYFPCVANLKAENGALLLENKILLGHVKHAHWAINQEDHDIENCDGCFMLTAYVVSLKPSR